MANKKPGAQPKKKHKQSNHPKPHGHFCYVCGEHKANEKFTGRGHANHICQVCQALPAYRRNEMIAVRKIGNMAFRHLSETEIKWLRGKMNDSRPEVRAAAREAHAVKFPRYERNMMKKNLTTRSLEFFIHGEVWDEYGDERRVHMRFFADSTGVMRRVDYDTAEGERETEIKIRQPDALKFLKAVVHEYNAPFWSEDLSDAGPGDEDAFSGGFDAGKDDENFDWALYVEDESADEPEPADTGREPVCSLKLTLTKGYGERTQTLYNRLHDEPQELFWALMSWFEPDEGESGGFEDETDAGGTE